MTRAKPPKEILNRREAGKAPPPKPMTGQFLTRAKAAADIAWKVAVFLATILGIASGWIAMVPRISVSQNQPLNPTDPFSTPFIVSNDGPLPIETVAFICHVANLRDRYGTAIVTFEPTPEHPGAGFTTPELKSAEMKPGERATMPCAVPFRFGSPLATGDIAIEATFRIGYTFIQTSRTARFVTQKANDGNLYWFPQPLAEVGNKGHH